MLIPNEHVQTWSCRCCNHTHRKLLCMIYTISKLYYVLSQMLKLKPKPKPNPKPNSSINACSQRKHTNCHSIIITKKKMLSFRIFMSNSISIKSNLWQTLGHMRNLFHVSPLSKNDSCSRPICNTF